MNVETLAADRLLPARLVEFDGLSVLEELYAAPAWDGPRGPVAVPVVRPEQRLAVAGEEVIARAARAGVSLAPVGVRPLFDEIRGFRGEGSDWLVAPAHADPQWSVGEMRMPQDVRAHLQRVAQAVDFPLIYVAHEAPGGSLDGARDRRVVAADGSWWFEVEPSRARELVRPGIAPAAVTSPAGRVAVSQGSQRLERALKVLGIGAAAIALAPALLAVGAVAALANLDPAVFGAIPLDGDTSPGTPAMFFLLAYWVE